MAHKGPSALRDLWSELDRSEQRIPLEVLTARLRQVEILEEDIRPYVRFGERTYLRNLVHSGPAYSALLLCWRLGQRSPIHDHRGSSCGVRVIRGTALETRFERSPHGFVYATGSRELPEGSVCGSQDGDMHQVSNLLAPGGDLITLHIYSPPLLVMGEYSLTEPAAREFHDPVVSLCDGAGI